MKKICQTRGLATYEAPEAEMIEMDFEAGILILSNETGNSSIRDLEEEDYSNSEWI